MNTREEVVLARDCTAIAVPEGTSVSLSAGTRVVITQALGGSFTVMTPYGTLVRIEERDADSLGRETTTPENGPGEPKPLEERVWDQLRKCYDPEIPVNIVELGLVYDCKVEADTDDLSKVAVKMTLTAPGCGMGDVLVGDVKRKIEALAGVGEADVELVFDPQWSVEMMSEAARLQLGML